MLRVFVKQCISLLLSGVFLLAGVGCAPGGNAAADGNPSAAPSPIQTVLPSARDETEPPTNAPESPSPVEETEAPTDPLKDAEATENVLPLTTEEPTPDEPDRLPWINLRDNEASGTLEKRSNKAVIDYSHTELGYVMVQKLVDSDRVFKVQVVKGGATYTYNLPYGEWSTFPLSQGDGRYTVTVYENTSGTKYAQLIAVSFDVRMESEFEPFLRPSQYISYMVALDAFMGLEALTEAGEKADTLDKVDVVYRYVTENMHYDYIQAATVKSGYVPDLNRVVSRKRGICFDFSSVMTSMLRLCNVPCKMVFGYVGEAYHAWISVWTAEEGWIDTIYFDGVSWQRMDPTFASVGSTDESIAKYIGNGKNYAEKYYY